MKLTQEQLQNAQSLRGKFRPGYRLTDAERQVAEFQGLLNPDGTLKTEAMVAADGDKTPKIPVVPLSEIANTDELEGRIAEIRGGATPSVEPPDTADGLPPPTEEAPTVQPEAVSPSEPSNIARVLAEAKEPVLCGHCGWDHRVFFQDPACDEQDRAAFVRHVMSRNGRFFKDFKLFDGQVTVRMRSRLQDEVETIVEAARKQMHGGNLVGTGDWQVQLQRYSVAASVESIVHGPDSQVFPTLAESRERCDDDDVKAVENLCNDVFGGRSVALYNAITAIWIEFERLYGWLTSRAHSENFWRAARGPR